MPRPVISGWAHGRFGKADAPDSEALIAPVVEAALAHAEIEPQDVDALVLGVLNNGFSKQDFQAALVGVVDDRFRSTPALRVENACATGSAALFTALEKIEAGAARHVLVVGVEKMTATATADVGDILLGASYRKEEAGEPGGFAGVFGRIAQSYFQRYGDRSESLARIAAKNHRNGVDNPYAHLRKDLGFAFCNAPSEKNPRVAGPLRRTDCSLISDGAAALVVSSEDEIEALPRAVGFAGRAHVNDALPLSRRDPTRFAGAEAAWAAALDRAEATLGDLDLVETHDCFTIAELLEYEAMGLCRPGDGARAIDEGWTLKGGRLPVNPSGGLKAKGHPIGATGVSMHVMACLQLMGEAEGMQIGGAATAGVFNMGGAAVANYVSILRRLK
ncbi:MAG: acetyl-CoA acetyltransferase [Alphaproteobacteria bacterium]|nr:acetyl-CoA acetyltransferase [Alphaproteobacteria bacterium]